MKLASLLLLGLCLGASACKKKPEEPPAVPPEDLRFDDLESVPLSIAGINYTDLIIEYFTVNSVGGGDIPVSDPESGGGGGVCCLRWFPGVSLPFPVEVEWSRDLKRWCKKQVLIQGPVPPHPDGLLVEFFPDGRIEVNVTEGFPEAKLRLERFSPRQRKESGNSVRDEQIATCRDGQ